MTKYEKQLQEFIIFANALRLFQIIEGNKVVVYHRERLLRAGKVPIHFGVTKEYLQIEGQSPDKYRYGILHQGCRRAFNWLFSEPTKIRFQKDKEWPHILVRLKVGNRGIITGSQWKYNADWENLREEDFPLALSVIHGEADVEFIDYLQDNYGVTLP